MGIELQHSKSPLYSAGGREKNQDAFKIYPPTEDMPFLFRYVVADGLGGQGGGELASWAAIKKTSEVFFDTEKLANQFETAHQHIKSCQLNGPQELARMATTLVVLMIMGDKAIWGHVGDSRLYMFRNGEIHHQTKDHSVPQMLVSSGEIEEKDIRHHPDRNRLLRALGDNREKIQALVHEEQTLREGDVFLICTDGFWEYVTEEEMLTSLYEVATPDEWLKLMEEQYLIPATKEEARREGKNKEENDNYTAIAVWYGEYPSITKHSDDDNVPTLSFEEKIASWLSELRKQLKDNKQHILQRLSEYKISTDIGLTKDISEPEPYQPQKSAKTLLDSDKKSRPVQTKISPEKEAMDRKLASIRADHPSKHKMHSTSKQRFWRFWRFWK